MEVILREDVKTLGKAGALVRVKPGYARNFLLPHGLAYEATEGNKKRLAAESKARETKATMGKSEANAQAAKLAGRNSPLRGKRSQEIRAEIDHGPSTSPGRLKPLRSASSPVSFSTSGSAFLPEDSWCRDMWRSIWIDPG